MAINDVQIWILTAFSLVPTNDFIRKCCLMCLKNTSLFHRSLYSSATVAAVHCLWLVKKPILGQLREYAKKMYYSLIVQIGKAQVDGLLYL